MLGLFLTVCVVAVIGSVFTSVTVTAPARAARRHDRLRAIKDVHVSRNHQELFLLMNDLLALHQRGYMSVFPDDDTLDRARKLTYTYREEIGP
jgi:hypothetical protein